MAGPARPGQHQAPGRLRADADNPAAGRPGLRRIAPAAGRGGLDASRLMGFVAPLALVGLLAMPLIVAFYMLRLRRPRHEVSSTYLWQALVRDVEANAPWQRLRRSLLLLLQLLLAVLLAFLVARPFSEHPAALARDIILV